MWLCIISNIFKFLWESRFTLRRLLRDMGASRTIICTGGIAPLMRLASIVSTRWILPNTLFFTVPARNRCGWQWTGSQAAETSPQATYRTCCVVPQTSRFACVQLIFVWTTYEVPYILISNSDMLYVLRLNIFLKCLL